MATYALWAAGIGLESLILFRSVKSTICRTYPRFCVYMVCILVSDAALWPLYRMASPQIYQRCYWAKEFICVIAGYAVVLEILERALESYDGPKKLARNAALAVFTLIVAFTSGEWLLQRSIGFPLTGVEVQRDLRSAELVLLSLIICLLLYYHIPAGRNLKGIVLGYGLCVATVVAGDAFRSYAGMPFQNAFSFLRSYSFFASLLIWTIFLWSYDPNPLPEHPAQLAHDYNSLTNWTKGTLAGMRGHLRRAARP
jgi:hypothetical protein